MKKILCFIIAGILVFETYYIFYLTKQNDLMVKHNNNCVEQLSILDSLLLEVSAERDSLLSKIDTTKTKIVYVKEKYKEEYLDVANQSIGYDIEFFSKYLSENN